MQKALKRWMHATAILFAVMLVGANTGLAQVTVSLDDITGRPSETAMVAIDISGVESGPAIRSFNFQVVTDAGISWTGVSASETLSGAALFQTNFNVVTGVVGSFSTAPSGTDIEASGNLIYLTFDLDSESAGTVTLANFTFNDGTPAVTGTLSAPFTVSTRIISVVQEHETRVGEAYTNAGQNFKILVNIEDELVAGDEVAAFSFILNYDATLMSINTSMGFGGVETTGGITANAVVNANDDGVGAMLVGGFTLLSTPLVGDGLFLTIHATATSATGVENLILRSVVFNTGTPIYAARVGTLTVLPFNVASEDELGLPSEFALKGNYPNPFNPSTTIQFDLPESADVSIAVMDLLGRQVMSIPTQTLSAGSNRTVQINAGALSSGIYLYRITAKTVVSTSVKVGTMTLLK